MKTVTVCVNITYNYTLTLNDDVIENTDNLVSACDDEDPIYYDAVDKCLRSNWLLGTINSWDGDLVSIVDTETGEILWDK